MNNERQTSLISFVISVAFWFLLTNSLPMAIGILVLIFIHEMGHFYAARMKGMSVALPVFTPLGAMVRLNSHTANARDEAFVAFAGPLVGGIASLIALTLGYVLGGALLFQLGIWGVVINLLNLVPLEPLDGGKISLAIERRMYFLGIPLFIYFMMQIGLSLFNIIMAALILREAWTAIQMRNQQADVAPSFFRVSLLTRVGYATAYAVLAALLAWVTLQPGAFLKVLVSLGL